MKFYKHHCALVMLTIGFVFLFSSVAFAEDERLIPYPSFSAAKVHAVRDWAEVLEIQTQKVSLDSASYNDLKWLQTHLKNTKVIMVGERHYSADIHKLTMRLLFAANTWDRFSLLLLELPYSEGLFYNHYVHMQNDQEAEAFLKKEISDFVYFKDYIDMLKWTRAWNKNHPDRKINVGCHDIEHNFAHVVNNVLIPYFKPLDSSLKFAEDASFRDLKPLLPKLKKLVRKAKKQNLKGEYAFLTADAIGNIVDNLEALLHAYSARKKGFPKFTHYRQKQIRKILMSPEYFGNVLRNEKVLMHVGSLHATQYASKNFHKKYEGYHLEHKFSPTRHKVLSLLVDYAAVTFKPVDFKTYEKSKARRTGHRSLIYKFKKTWLHQNGKFNFNQAYFLNELSKFDWIRLNLFYEHHNKPLVYKNIDLDVLTQEIKKAGLDPKKELKHLKRNLKRYDILIDIPKSKITTFAR